MRLFGRRLRGRSFPMEVEPGILIPADLSDYMCYWTFIHGFLQSQPAMRLSRLLVQPGDTVVDVGANIGLWVLGAARRAGAAGRVIAFEPVQANLARLMKHAILNHLDWIECERLAVSDACGRTVIYGASNGNSGMASLVTRAGIDLPEDTEQTTLDHYFTTRGLSRLDVLKVDVEGAELLVFKGATGILSSTEAPIIMLELADAHAAAFGTSSGEVKQLLTQLGYELFRYDGQSLSTIAIAETHRQEDVFALKPHHFVRHPFLRALRAF
jgi:FkbM family methyltransferase